MGQLIGDLPNKAAPVGSELVELQDGTGADSSKHATLAQIFAALGGASGWSIVTSNTTMAPGTPYLADATGGEILMSLPGTINPGNEFVVRAENGSVVIVAGAGRSLAGLANGDDIQLSDGQTITLVAKTATVLELVGTGFTSNMGVQRVTANFTAAVGVTYLLGADNITATLPASPAVGDRIGFVLSSSSFTNVTIGRNGKLIMELAENMTVSPGDGFELIFDGDTYGWRIA